MSDFTNLFEPFQNPSSMRQDANKIRFVRVSGTEGRESEAEGRILQNRLTILDQITYYTGPLPI